MTQTIVADLARQSFAAVQQRVEGPSASSPEAAADVLSGYKVACYALEELWKRVQASLEAGSERGSFAQLLAAFRDTVELNFATANAASKALRDSHLSTQQERDDEAYLESTRVRAHEMRDWALGLLRWMEAERPRSDPQALPTATGDREVYISLDQFLNQRASRRTA
jgi:hypothetical protein